MTPDQRKRHKVTWVGLAIIIPVLFFLAVKNIVPDYFSEDLYFNQPVAFSNVLNSEESSLLLYNIRSENNSYLKQLELVVKKPLSVPGASIIIRTENMAGGENIGLLQSKGIYRYNLDSLQSVSKNLNISVLDEINDKGIDKMEIILK